MEELLDLKYLNQKFKSMILRQVRIIPKLDNTKFLIIYFTLIATTTTTTSTTTTTMTTTTTTTPGLYLRFFIIFHHYFFLIYKKSIILVMNLPFLQKVSFNFMHCHIKDVKCSKVHFTSDCSHHNFS